MAGDVSEWLEGLGLGRYADAFGENEIDLDALPYITEDDLKDIGVALGARRKMLAAIAELEPATEQSSEDGVAGDRPSGVEAERRQLTVMFCDLVGSTELSRRLDPEDLREVMRRYQDAVAGAVTRYEGYVAKFLGDGVLAYFGWPRAHEDQAERAVRTGLDAVAAVVKLKLDNNVALQARVGIATGRVVVGDLVGEVSAEAEAVAGETPNLAARLQGVAAPGQVVIGATCGYQKCHPARDSLDPISSARAIQTGESNQAAHKSFYGKGGQRADTENPSEVTKSGPAFHRWREAVGVAP